MSSRPGLGAIVRKLTQEMCASSGGPSSSAACLTSTFESPGEAPSPEIAVIPAASTARALRVGRLGDQIRVVDPGRDRELDHAVEEREARAVHEQIRSLEQPTARRHAG